ncbi:MAG: DUF1015 domain-containing protein [Clostridiaceae bacterium]|nr:DUF1015 domain-containing protein [Clostridiaceae bacterium]
MAIVRPFKAVRPTKELAARVAALPYDVMSSEEAREMVKDNPYSFLHVDKAEIDLPEDTNLYDQSVYKKAKSNLQEMISTGVFFQEEKSNLYIYRLISKGRSQTGIVACTSIDEYLNNSIKKHEYTRPDKEADRINHVDYCDANTGPIFLTYKNKKDIDTIVSEIIKNSPEYDFIAEDGVTHMVWAVEEDVIIEKLCTLFQAVESLYIADGHHRCASAARVGQMRRQEKPEYTGEEEFNFFLSVIFPEKDLYIMDYNRIVKELNGHSEQGFLQKVSDKFKVKEYCLEGPYKPSSKGTYGMYLNGKWYQLEIKDGISDLTHPVKSLDVSILQDNLLYPILGIEDPRTDERIDFMGGIRGLEALRRKVDGGKMKVAFSMYPTTIEELMNIADAGEVMPPKSTWFEPKPRSGLFIHTLK